MPNDELWERLLGSYTKYYQNSIVDPITHMLRLEKDILTHPQRDESLTDIAIR
jgi:hypothetical protein